MNEPKQLRLFDPSRDLTFNEVAEANRERLKRWHHFGTASWTGADWSNAMCGKAGETANVVKKLRRAETRTFSATDPIKAELLEKLGNEIADTFLYLSVLADHYEIDMPAAIVRKFNLVSEMEGFPERLREP